MLNYPPDHPPPCRSAAQKPGIEGTRREEKEIGSFPHRKAGRRNAHTETGFIVKGAATVRRKVSRKPPLRPFDVQPQFPNLGEWRFGKEQNPAETVSET